MKFDGKKKTSVKRKGKKNYPTSKNNEHKLFGFIKIQPENKITTTKIPYNFTYTLDMVRNVVRCGISLTKIIKEMLNYLVCPKNALN